MSTSLQYKIQAEYESLLSMLRDARNSMDDLSPSNEDIKYYVTTFRDILVESIEKTEKRIMEIQTSMVWDHLVIAFFGPTNAGKSTIIETLRLKYEKEKMDFDGEIVGTGKPDFTEKFDEYNLYIDGKKFTIIDMPGILSNEQKYIEQISSALNKAHIVLYVDRDGTTPDTETVKKIKSYLQDWVKVYTVYNVSGFMPNKESLQDNKVQESASLIEQGYRKALGQCYAGNIIIHAFFALASIANFPESRSDLTRKQASSIKKFSSKEDMFAYSEFSSLICFIKDQMNNYLDEIAAANRQRLNAIKTQTKNCLYKELNKKAQKQRKIPIELRKFKNDVSRYYDTSIADINSSCYPIISKHISHLGKECKLLVDNGEKELEKKCDSLQEETIQNIITEQKQAIEKIINQLAANIKRRKNKLESFIPELKTQAVYTPGQSRIDFKGAQECVNFNFENVMDILGDIAGGALIGFCINPVIAVFTGVLGLCKGVYDSFWGDSYKKKAKAAIETAVEKLKQKLISSMRESVANTTQRIAIQKK